MKIKIIVLFTLLGLSAGLVRAGENVQVVVKGMVCSFCAQGLDKKFKAQPAVDKVKVTFDDQSIRLTLKDKKELSDKEITDLIEDSGYNVEAIHRNQN